jgi:hypothetical protein
MSFVFVDFVVMVDYDAFGGGDGGDVAAILM